MGARTPTSFFQRVLTLTSPSPRAWLGDMEAPSLSITTILRRPPPAMQAILIPQMPELPGHVLVGQGLLPVAQGTLPTMEALSSFTTRGCTCGSRDTSPQAAVVRALACGPPQMV